MNRIVLFGHLGHSPQLRVKAHAAHFSLAVNEPYRGAAGEKVERTTWFDVVSWDALADRVMEHLRSGDQVLVEGRIELREFQGRDGTPRAMLSVTAFRIEFGAKAQRDETPVEAEELGDGVEPDFGAFGSAEIDGPGPLDDDIDIPF